MQDRCGLTWQISLGKIEDVGQKIAFSFLFVNEQMGKGEEAIRFYTSIFEESVIDGILKYGPGEEGTEGTVKHAQFSLLDNIHPVVLGGGKPCFPPDIKIKFRLEESHTFSGGIVMLRYVVE